MNRKKNQIGIVGASASGCPYVEHRLIFLIAMKPQLPTVATPWVSDWNDPGPGLVSNTGNRKKGKERTLCDALKFTLY